MARKSMKPAVGNRLAAIRKTRGVGAANLARCVGVSRNTIYAIEAGTYLPNTEVALRLARELEVTVDELFVLPDAAGFSSAAVSADVLSAAPLEAGQPVRLCQVGSHRLGVPVSASPYYLPEADGLVQRVPSAHRRADIGVFANEESAVRCVVLAGCDPAMGLVGRTVEKVCGFEVVCAPASSTLALQWLKESKVHIAGTHLQEPKSGEYNLPFIRREFSDDEVIVVTFARWEEGLVVAAGNPKRIRSLEDLGRKNVRLVNREPGSGSRALLDRLIRKIGLERQAVSGYGRIAFGHLAAARSVVSGEADVCLATSSAARNYRLDFIPLHSERYDLVMRRPAAGLPGVRAFLDVLQLASLRRKLELLAGYDISETGRSVA